MAEIIQEEKGKKKGGKKHPPHIDMTPMVDLMCLLITFFMLTTAFSKAKVMEIVLPEKLKDPNAGHLISFWDRTTRSIGTLVQLNRKSIIIFHLYRKLISVPMVSVSCSSTETGPCSRRSMISTSRSSQER
jgi:hypothetical protein